MNDLVERLCVDEELADYYETIDTDALPERLSLLFTTLIGGPGTGVEADLSAAHGQPFTLTPEQWMRWAGHLMTVLHLHRRSDAEIEEFALVLTRLGPPLNLQDDGPAGDPTGAAGPTDLTESADPSAPAGPSDPANPDRARA